VLSLACRRVWKFLACRRSTFNDSNSVSEQALSQQLPLRLIEAASRIITAAVKAVPVKQIGYSRLISTLTFS
jgi:hypothetical protein